MFCGSFPPKLITNFKHCLVSFTHFWAQYQLTTERELLMKTLRMDKTVLEQVESPGLTVGTGQSSCRGRKV